MKLLERMYYNLFILFTSIIAVSLILIDRFEFDETVLYYLKLVDYAISVIFVLDFCLRFISSPNGIKYFLAWGWIDLLSAIPMVGVFQILRVLRIFKLVISFSRHSKVYNISQDNDISKAVVGIVIVYALFFLCAEFFYLFEYKVNEHVNNFSDAVWWSFVTLTTVGYGDIVPVTAWGRGISILLLIVGLGVFSLTFQWGRRILEHFSDREYFFVDRQGKIFFSKDFTGYHLKYDDGKVILLRQAYEVENEKVLSTEHNKKADSAENIRKNNKDK